MTGKLFPSGNFVDTITMDDGSIVDVTIVDMVNPCGFFKAEDIGLGCTGLELPNPDNTLTGPAGIGERLAELRLKVAHLMGWNQLTKDTIGKSALPFAVSVAPPGDYPSMAGPAVKASDVDVVARFYGGTGEGGTGMHTAAPGSGSTCLAAAVAIPGTVPNQVLGAGGLKSGKGGDFTFGHPSGSFGLHSVPSIDADPNKCTYKELNFPRTARIISDGTVYIKEVSRPEQTSWVEADHYTAASFFLLGDHVSIQR